MALDVMIWASSDDLFAIDNIGFPADIKLKVLEGTLKSKAFDSKVTTPKFIATST